jgi:hypothetical protein
MSEYDNGFRRAQAQYEAKTPYDNEVEDNRAIYTIEGSVMDNEETRLALSNLNAYDIEVIDTDADDEYRNVISFTISNKEDSDDVEDATNEYNRIKTRLREIGAYLERDVFETSYVEYEPDYDND